MAALTAAIVTAIASIGVATESIKQGRRTRSKTKREAGRRRQEQEALAAEERKEEEKEQARLTRDQQRAARVSARRGAQGREGTLIPLAPTTPGGSNVADKQLIGV